MVNLRMNRSSNRPLSYLLYDMSGKLQATGELTDNGAEIQMGYLAPATYLLNVTDNDKPIKIFKIIKK
ncbi:MAG: T9SS type A sorting domain-containing protein [Prolixibacteraceae bacterium]|jgi:hypothetical protein|nr:T9SS type A sorting domain-containing protein [Prolixibacteraceae bacterium]